MERETGSGSVTADHEEAAPQPAPGWWPYAREFPSWYVWLGVAGHCYARVLRSSPARVVRARDVDDLRAEIIRAELSGRPLATRPHLGNHCA